jgi:formylglycine-generating enzyme required for sulfatase activity
MVEHPKGTTFMGSRSLPDHAGARVEGRRVTVSAFCLDTTEVTADAYEACVAQGACERAPDGVSFPGLSDESRLRFKPFCNGAHARSR